MLYRKIVEITPAGITYVNEMNEQALMKIESLLDHMSKEEFNTFIQISHRIRDAVDK